MFTSIKRASVLLLIVAIAFTNQTYAGQSKQQTPVKRNGSSQGQDASAAQPIALVQQPAPDYLSGEANVAVKGNMNPIIRLGMSQNGVTMIEFPVSDRFFAIHPGNSELVMIDESPTKATDHFLVMRAGSSFAAPSVAANVGRGPASSIIVQMQSGMVITFLIYPVPYLAQQAHRCVVSYDRNEVVSARRAAGLAVNLDGTALAQQQTSSVRIASGQPVESTGTTVTSSPRTLAPVIAEIDTKQSPIRSNKKDGDDRTRVVATALAEAVRAPNSFKKWSDPVHGLAVSVSQVREVDAHSRLVVIAVRNTEATTIQVAPGAPDIYVQTLDKKGYPLQIEQIKKLVTETTTINSSIPAGATCYYALVYETPILGASQRLRVSVAQVNAADEPSSAELTPIR
ncbi:MAG: hypothetical protein WBV94_28340 [Blastocatellia bacterium]